MSLLESFTSQLQIERVRPFNITELLSRATLELNDGEMIHTDDFSLFDAMSALELMDPKMDSGMVTSGISLLPVSRRLKDGTIDFSFSSANDVLQTIDQLFQAETAWFDGQSFSHTLFTCLYLHGEPRRVMMFSIVDFEMSEKEVDFDGVLEQVPPRVKNTLALVMNAICLGILKSSSKIRDVVIRADIYEEEDFSPPEFDVDMADDIPSEIVKKFLDYAERRLEALLSEQKMMSSRKSLKKPFLRSFEPLHSNCAMNGFLIEALLKRVRFRKAMFDAIMTLGIAEASPDFKKARDQFSLARQILVSIETETLELDFEHVQGKAMGFDESICRLLPSSSPPRVASVPKIELAVKMQLHQLDDLLYACQPKPWKNMDEFRKFLISFSSRQPGIIARSYTLLFLSTGKKIYGVHSFMEWLSGDMEMNGVPSVLLSTQEGVLFSSKSIEAAYESLKIYLHNRTRQRARLEFVLEEWSMLQVEAAAVDEKFTTEMGIPKASYPRYFSAWTLEHTLILMIHYLWVGFELELYSISEYPVIYWYLDYLLGSRAQNLKVTSLFVEKMKQMVDSPDGGMKKSISNGRKKALESVSDSPESDGVNSTKTRFLNEVRLVEMHRAAVRAYFQLLSSAQSLRRSSEAPHNDVSLKALCFQHRFAALKSSQFPSPLSYEDYQRSSDFASYKSDIILKSAEECFRVVRTYCEDFIKDSALEYESEVVSRLLTVVSSNCSNLSRHGAALVEVKLQFDFTEHPLFPLLTLII